MTTIGSRGLPGRFLSRARAFALGRPEDEAKCDDGHEDLWTLFDAQAQGRLGMSGEEFERRWERGEFSERIEDPDVVFVRMLRPTAPRN